ncbi:MAG: hypothetical protein IKO45_02280 [Clostridia bacterium]|nr:hypothetical protein [Clostridia bacterium]
MAKPSVVINSTTYATVPQVNIPLSGGGGNATFYYCGDADITAADIINGKKGYGASGEITGTLTVATVSQDGTSKVLTIS